MIFAQNLILGGVKHNGDWSIKMQYDIWFHQGVSFETHSPNLKETNVISDSWMTETYEQTDNCFRIKKYKTRNVFLALSSSSPLVSSKYPTTTDNYMPAGASTLIGNSFGAPGTSHDQSTPYHVISSIGSVNNEHVYSWDPTTTAQYGTTQGIELPGSIFLPAN